MSKTKRKRYTGAFKAKVGLEALMGVKTVGQIAREYQVHPVQVTQWKAVIREPLPMPSAPGRKKIIATGCYDWFHSGHVRFTEEASGYGDLYVCLGSDANVRLLKGPGHPLLTQEERRYVVGSIKICEAGTHHHRIWLGGCRPGNPPLEAGHLRRQRGW